MSRRKRTAKKVKRRTPVSVDDMVDVVSPALRVARTAWMKGRYDEALQLFETTVRSEPRNVRACVDAARAYASRYDFPRMERFLDRLRNLSSSHPGGYHLIGDTYVRLKLFPQAIAAYEQATSLPGALPVTWVELASLYERTHCLEAAREAVERALQLEPHLPMARFVQAPTGPP